MPKRTDIKSIMIIGAGPIIIGQACEFDYSGAQACKALRAEGYRVILVNSNPATIMTDPQFADRTYIEPLTPASVLAILERERPDALLPTLGGQTALNVAVALAESGDLDRLGVQLIGASLEAIHRAEDRSGFKEAMVKAGLDVPRAGIAALDAVNGLPLSWNPGRTRGVGAQALFATNQGLWVGSDTTRIGGETHGRVALLPLAGGSTVPAVAAATLPNDLFVAPRAAGAVNNVLYRVNAAGPGLLATDGGRNWTTDAGLVSGGNATNWGATVPRDTTVPAAMTALEPSTDDWVATWSAASPSAGPTPGGPSGVLTGRATGARAARASPAAGSSRPAAPLHR